MYQLCNNNNNNNLWIDQMNIWTLQFNIMNLYGLQHGPMIDTIVFGDFV